MLGEEGYQKLIQNLKLQSSLSSGKTSTAARCRVYVRDEEKIAVIFDMMKRKCVKTDSDKVTGLTPNIVTVSQNSLPVSVSYLLWVVVLRTWWEAG